MTGGALALVLTLTFGIIVANQVAITAIRGAANITGIVAFTAAQGTAQRQQ